MTNGEISELKKELEFLYRVAQSVHSLEIKRLLSEIINIASEITQADSCLIYVFDRKEQKLILRASKNPHPELLQKIKMRVGEGITGWVAEEKKAVAITRNANKDPRFKLFRNLPEDRFEAFLSVPILDRHGVVGVINVQHQREHEHTQMEIDLLTAIGKLLGGAVENAVLIEETLTLKEALELRKTVEKAKGIIMKKTGLSEEEAFKMLQKESMVSGKSLRMVAEAVLITRKMGY